MHILHLAAECYPMAKVGGLADVVGALPGYQTDLGHQADVLMPMHRTNYLTQHAWDVVHKGTVQLGPHRHTYTIIRQKDRSLRFTLYLMDIYGLLDRERVYGYDDDTYRYLAFQTAALDWINQWDTLPHALHVHDHHTALIPFLLRHAPAYHRLSGLRTVLTIHNAQYQGWMPVSHSYFLPPYDPWKQGLLEWNGNINALACGVKCADYVTTVSHSYMQELSHRSNGLEDLFRQESGKCRGILNGIDNSVWDPAHDPMIPHPYDDSNPATGKRKNKSQLCHSLGLDPDRPLFIFIGRLVEDKAADLLPDCVTEAIQRFGQQLQFVLLGSGDSAIEQSLHERASRFPEQCRFLQGYNEALSHQMYAAADFLLMPSRVEPCGLNQLYALRYGTMPMVRRTGGLQDTVTDLGDPGGFGLCFLHASIPDMLHALARALDVYANPAQLQQLQERMMKINHGWERSAAEYSELYP